VDPPPSDTWGDGAPGAGLDGGPTGSAPPSPGCSSPALAESETSCPEPGGLTTGGGSEGTSDTPSPVEDTDDTGVSPEQS